MDLFVGIEIGTRCQEPEPEIEVLMAGIATLPGRVMVDIHIEQARPDEFQAGRPGLLADFTACRRLGIGIGEIDMATRLDPDAQPTMVDQQHARLRGIDHEPARSEVTWIEGVAVERVIMCLE